MTKLLTSWQASMARVITIAASNGSRRLILYLPRKNKCRMVCFEGGCVLVYLYRRNIEAAGERIKASAFMGGGGEAACMLPYKTRKKKKHEEMTIKVQYLEGNFYAPASKGKGNLMRMFYKKSGVIFYSSVSMLIGMI